MSKQYLQMFNPQTEEERCLPTFSVSASPISVRKLLGLHSWKCLLFEAIHSKLSLANLGIEGADFLACEAFESGIKLSLFLSLHGMDICIS